MRLKLILVVVVIIILCSTFAITSMERKASEEKALVENRTQLQMEYIRSLQAESYRILTEDQKFQAVLKGKTSYKIYEIIHNESVVENIYLVDFQPEKLKYGGKGFKMVNGTICRFYIDLKTKTVQIEENNEQNSFDCDSGLLVMTRSISIVSTWQGPWRNCCSMNFCLRWFRFRSS